MLLDRARRDPQALGDRAVGQAGGDELENLGFARREPVQIFLVAVSRRAAQLGRLVNPAAMRPQELEQSAVARREVAVGAVEDEVADALEPEQRRVLRSKLLVRLRDQEIASVGTDVVYGVARRGQQ